MGWSWQELMATPMSVVNEVINVMNEEQEEMEFERLKHQT
jgi:hypothetical protein